MTLQEAEKKLLLLRKHQARIKTQMQELREIILSKGGDPYFYESDFSTRNKAIYHMRLQGITFREIGAQHGLSAAGVRGIFKYVEAIIKKKRDNYRFYANKPMST